MVLSMLLSVISIAWSVYIVRAWRVTTTDCISKYHTIYIILYKLISLVKLLYLSKTKKICECSLSRSRVDHIHNKETDNDMICMWHTSLDVIDKVMFLFQAVVLFVAIFVFMVILPVDRGYFT